MTDQPNSDSRVLILYDELESGVYAKAIFDPIIQRLPKENQITFNIWNFEAIQIPATKTAVQSAADHSDMIVFAVRDDQPIAPWVLDWANTWMSQKEPYTCAFIGIIINPNTWPAVPPDSLNRAPLRKLAEKNHFAFFTQEIFAPSTRTAQTARSMARRFPEEPLYRPSKIQFTGFHS